MANLVIIGGGPSGMMAAIQASNIVEKSHQIIILEKNDRLGKKILATGNGKCNFTNAYNTPSSYNNKDFVKEVINQFDYKKNVEFFNSLGVLAKSDEEGRYYPYNDASSTILDALRFKIDEQGVICKFNFDVNKIIKKNDKFIIFSKDNQKVDADIIIFAFGGKSYPTLGSNGEGYNLVTSLGHSITNLYPAITSIKVLNDDFKSLSGIKVSGDISLYNKNKLLNKQRGEILFKDDSISGIATFIVSSYLAREFFIDKNPKFSIELDLLPIYSFSEVKELLLKRKQQFASRTVEHFLHGMFVKMLSYSILKLAHLDKGALIQSLMDLQLEELTHVIKAYPVKVKELGSFANAQVTCGGVKTSDVNPQTLESKINDSLYFCGEALDVDGDCGGHNLQWAFSSGYVSGINAAKKINKK